MILLKKYLEDWFENDVSSSVTLSTKISYETIIYKHIIPFLGDIEINNLGKSDISGFYKYLLTEGNLTNKRGLSIKTVSNIHACLSSAISNAMNERLVSYNVMLLIKKPSYHTLNVAKNEIEVFSVNEQKVLLKECPLDNYGIAILIALLSGVRMGELLGLKWSDISADGTYIKVQRQVNRLKNYENIDKSTTLGFLHYTKSKKNRVFYVTKQIRELLILMKTLQKNVNNIHNLIFCNTDEKSSLYKSFVEPKTLRSHYYKTLNMLQIKKYTFHALRHTFATRSLEAGLDFKVISKLLGHSSVKFTMDTYVHVLPEFCDVEVKKIENYISFLVE